MLKEGDSLFMGEKIAGHYTADPVQPGDTVLFLSTGTGEALDNYMLWQLLRRGHQGRILLALLRSLRSRSSLSENPRRVDAALSKLHLSVPNHT